MDGQLEADTEQSKASYLLHSRCRPSTDPAYPDVTPRDAKALREWDAMRKAAE